MQGTSFYQAFNVRHDDEVTITLESGEKFYGFIENTQQVLEDTLIEDLILILAPKYGRGERHRIVATKIMVVTKRY